MSLGRPRTEDGAITRDWGNRSGFAFSVILGTYLVLALLLSVIVPLGEAPDEVSHWAYVQYLAIHHALPKPEGAVLGESHQPPLYYLLGALATSWIPQQEFAAIANPDFGFDQAETPNLLLHTRREQFPYRDATLAWHLWRLFSIAMGAVTIWATYKTCEVGVAKGDARDLAGLAPGLGLAAAAFVAFLPGFTFLSAVVNNDNLVIMLSALGVLQTLRVARGAGPAWDLFLLGAILGFAALSKLSGLVLWLFAAAVLAWRAGHRRDWKGASSSAAWVFGIAIVIVSLWVIHNLAQYGDPLAWSLIMATTPVRRTPITWTDVAIIARGLWTSFWGRFGGAQHLRMADALYVALGLLPALSVAGWVRGTREKRDWGILVLFLLFWFLMLAAFVRWTLSELGTDMARQLYPGLPLFAIALMAGLGRLFAGRARVAQITASGALFALDVAVLAYLALTFAPPPLDPGALAHWGAAPADFGGDDSRP